MSFKDMVKAAAEAERQRRQRVRDEQAPQSELVEATTLDNSPRDSELPKAATEAPQKGRLSEGLNFNSDTQREAARKGQDSQQGAQSTKSIERVNDTLREIQDCIATNEKENSPQLPLSRDAAQDGVSIENGDTQQEIESVEAAGHDVRQDNTRREAEVSEAVTLVAAGSQKDELDKVITKDNAQREGEGHEAVTLDAVSRSTVELSRAISYNTSAQQESQAAKTIERVDNALQEDEISSAARQDGDTQRTTEPVVRDGAEDGVEPQAQGSSQKPTTLTAQSLHGLKPRKRKRPSLEKSPKGLFVEEVTPPAAKQPMLSQSTHDNAEPTVKDEPGTAKDASKAPAGTQRKDTEGAAARNSGPAPRARAKRKPVYVSEEVVDMKRKASEWYLNINTNEKFPRGDKATLDHVRQLIKNCIDAVKNNGDKEKWFSELRTEIHDMDLYKWLSAVLVKKSKVLEPEGLREIIDGPDKDLFPFDIAADAEALWNRWMGGDIDGSLLRGIVITKTVTDTGAKNTSYRIEAGYPKKRSANVVGTNSLMNGQWWPQRICALRDGAHGAMEAGISGQAEKGAFSIVLSHGQYADEDHGETVEYCGTTNRTPIPTADTLLLEKSYLQRQPIRVLRAANKTSRYAPREGVRYDGLYEIVDREILDPAIAMSRFSLRRLAGQDPIRYQGVEARPTNQELMERMNIRRELE